MSLYSFWTPQKSATPGPSLSFTTRKDSSNFSFCDLDEPLSMPDISSETALPGWYLPNDPRAFSENSNLTGSSNKLSIMSSVSSSTTAASGDVLQENFTIRFAQLKGLEKCKNELIEVSSLRMASLHPSPEARRNYSMRTNMRDPNSLA